MELIKLKRLKSGINAERGKGVVVAILDTGIDTTHPDLKDRIIDGRNFTFEGRFNDITDRNGHGTHVAGTIAGSEDGEGVVGVAPEADLLICKVLDRNGSGSYRSITQAIRWATKWRGPNGERVRIINMSLGGPSPDEKQYNAILQACAEGILSLSQVGTKETRMRVVWSLVGLLGTTSVLLSQRAMKKRNLRRFQIIRKR